MYEIMRLAKEKLNQEEKDFSGGQKEKVIYKEVSQALQSFCENERFARAVIENPKTLSDCCKSVFSGWSGTGISDLEVYKRAAGFYFPQATVRFHMEICLDAKDSGSSAGGEIISLLDLI
ncbi:hypothetical protein [Caproicibacter fermentans]|uniref:Uncharacterized protein n=1 Tax=Caproicibacter fermentans TaxID=2576756 RepID=A0A7G8TD94_9FIRM|nr:hypothetical protein [Caproicibacter fermentans]QNK41585.1 hypothetical protein HCR03_04790 [Caproicibacter fermentans]